MTRKKTTTSRGCTSHLLLTGFLGIFWLASSIIASAADAPVQGRPDNGPPKNNVNAITQAAVKMGVLTCASRINQVTNFLSSGSENSAFLFLTKEAPDTHLFSASYEILKPDGTSGYASASFAPTQNPGGEAVYDVVEYKPV
ncbi:MAG: hypothetical protein WCG06_05675, partial [Candidatus Omnitrophota bacterium]